MKRQADPTLRTAPARAVSAFRDSEEGTLTIFGLFCFILMLIGAGIALDIMRSEVARTELQNTVDRAVLAAAGLDQTRDSEEIVRDYLRAAGVDPDSVEITSESSGMARTVQIDGKATTRSLFLDTLGLEQMVQPVSTEAHEIRTNLELSLVVDISGSMGGAKIDRLRDAAKDFVSKLLDGREDLTTVSLVPYNDRVNAGSLVASVFDLTDEHPYSNCVVFEDAEFGHLEMKPNTQLQRMGHFTRDRDYQQGNPAGLVPNPNCLTSDYGAIQPWSNDVSVLRNRIDGLQASNHTAIDLGVKWGTLLLDPSSQDELSALTTAEDAQVEPIFAGRPVAYGTEDTHKVLVVMTDGDNTQQWDLDPDEKSGPSNVWVYRRLVSGSGDTVDDGDGPAFGADGSACGQRVDGLRYFNCRARFDDTEGGAYQIHYSVWVPRVGKFWHDSTNEYKDWPYGGWNKAVRLDKAVLHASMNVGYLVNDVLRGADYDTRVDYYYNTWRTTHDQRRADRNLSNICREARKKNVIIYTIAFQAPPAGQAAMRDCAGDSDGDGQVDADRGKEARYYDVSDLNIEAAFNDVLASVSRLRLTQ